MENNLVTTEPRALDTISWLTPVNIEAGLKLADTMAKAKLVPEHLRNSPGDCLLVIAQACSWRMNPISVAQATAVVRGKLCYEGKLVAAVLTSLGAIEGRLSYQFSGTHDLAVTVTGTPRGGKPVSITGSVKQWRTDNKAWDNDPQSMLIYRGTRQWARLYAPEAMLGVMTPEDIEHGELDAGSIPATATRVQTVTEEPPTDQPPAAEKSKTAPKTRTTTNPAIATAKELFDTLPADTRMATMGRLCSLFGAQTTKDVPADQLEELGKIAGDLLALFRSCEEKESGTGAKAVNDTLEGMAKPAGAEVAA